MQPRGSNSSFISSSPPLSHARNCKRNAMIWWKQKGIYCNYKTIPYRRTVLLWRKKKRKKYPCTEKGTDKWPLTYWLVFNQSLTHSIITTNSEHSSVDICCVFFFLYFLFVLRFSFNGWANQGEKHNTVFSNHKLDLHLQQTFTLLLGNLSRFS